MKKLKVVLWVIAFVVLAGLIFHSRPIQNGIGVVQSFLTPGIWNDLEKEWEGRPTDFLLRELKGNNDFHAGVAIEILVKRKEKAAVPILLERIKSKNDQTRLSAFIALAELGDDRAIPPMMQIVKDGRSNAAYMDTLYAFSLMHYEPIYPEILRLVQDGYETSLAVGMLERFPEKPETLPALKKIAESDPESYIREKSKAAIEKITAQTATENSKQGKTIKK